MAAHVLVLPFLTQGHINPMLHTNVSIASISDGYDEGGPNSAPNFQTLVQSLEVVGSRTLAELIEKENQSMEPCTCMVFDMLMAWGDKVAQSVGLPSIAFSTQSCAITSIYYHFNRGSLDVLESGAAVDMFGLPPMERSDFPSIALKDRSYPAVIEFALNQLNFNKKGLPIASFKDYFHVRAIGPCLPFLPTANGSNAYGMNLWEPEDDAYMKWLNAKPANSVVYVSFAEQKTLPKGFVENPGEKGLVVTWSPQLKVLNLVGRI
ncbi:indole-3-acetate beta-glucosyltransferase-like [Carex rostrata]